MHRPRIDLQDLVRKHTQAASARASVHATGRPLREVTGFGSNPGALRMLCYVPEGLPAGAPLVVALHGCTQTAAGYDAGTGWSTLAEARGFAVLLPEQAQGNNPNRCFNWFEPGDTARGAGEALSIRQMVARMVADHGLDPARVFVTGLSAGGAMTSTMLATYPEVFAAGAIIAGLPHGAAASMPEAFEAMAGGKPRPAAELAAKVRAASPHRGPWPRVSIWQGDADATVRPVNADRIRQQWTTLHGLDAASQPAGLSAGHQVRVWRDAAGRPVVESHAIAGMAHGVPLDPAAGVGAAGPFMLDVGVSSTELIADFFGLPRAAQPRAAETQPPRGEARVPSAGKVIAVGQDGAARVGAEEPPLATRMEEPDTGTAWPTGAAGGIDPGEVIRRALTAAGLMKP